LLEERKRIVSWVYLFIAGLFEIAWAIGLKYTEGFTRPLPSVLTVAAMIISFAMLGLALRTLPLGTAYAVWTGIGTMGTVILGILLFQEPTDAPRLICIGLIIAGVAGLRFLSPH
jgi:quaternary ammonium compound-resistance protein SugE